MSDPAVLEWLLDSDPAIRWQVERDILHARPARWQATRARVETEGWGARLLSLRDENGIWAGVAFWPKEFSQAAYEAEGQAWTATSHCLTLLRQMGLDPASATSRTLRDQVGRIALWEKGDQPFWQGETEECINGRTLSDGVYFGADVSGIAARLITERQADGRWNCDRCRGTLRSSFANTINVLEGRSAFEQATGITPALRAALEAGQDYLLTRQLFRRASNGAVVDPDVLVLYHPWRWHYDILRALEYFRTSGVSKDRRLQQAADLLESRRLADGRWLLEPTSRGRVWFQRQPSGAQSRWITLQALRVLTWWNAWPGPKIPRRNLAPDAPRECATHLSTSLIPHFKMF